MCGIVGYITDEYVAGAIGRTNFITQALYADTFRGWDSTGILVVEKAKNKRSVYKKALAGCDFVRLKSYETFMNRMTNPRVVIGHNRAATRGSVYDETAHPFHYGDITLVHNGTLNNLWTLPEGNKFTVDSEWIAHSIDKRGLEATCKLMRGSYALVYFDGKDGSLNMITNGERPMFIGKANDEKTTVFGSEANMLSWIATRKEVGMDVPTENILEVAPGYLIKFVNDARKFSARKIDITPNEPEKTTHRSSVKSRTYTQSDLLRGDQVILDKFKLKAGDRLEFSIKDVDEKFQYLDAVLTDDIKGITKVRVHGGTDIVKYWNSFDKYHYGTVVRAAELGQGNVTLYMKDPIATNRDSDLYYLNDEEKGKKKGKEVEQKEQEQEEKKEQKSSKESTATSTSNVLYLPDKSANIRGPSGTIITMGEFERLASGGCDACGEAISLQDVAAVRYTINGGMPVCPTCVVRIAYDGYGTARSYLEQYDA